MKSKAVDPQMMPVRASTQPCNGFAAPTTTAETNMTAAHVARAVNMICLFIATHR